LAPLLDRYRLIAVDLSGQGFSDHRSPDATYHIWDDIPQLLAVIDEMRLDRLAVLGHSRGAAIAVLLAAALEDRCSQLVLLDGMLPRAVADEEAPAQFLQAQRDHQRLAKHRPRVFADVDEFVKARVRLGFSDQSARILAPRALRRGASGLALVHDPRLNHASAVKMSPAMCAAFYAALNTPTLTLMAEQGLRQQGELESAIQALSGIPECDLRTVPGSHHAHMEEGAEAIAGHIVNFIAQPQQA
jgi:pimeloyl-ACP methyl ester carboxylesterase